jgi:hypothetical protein
MLGQHQRMGALHAAGKIQHRGLAVARLARRRINDAGC